MCGAKNGVEAPLIKVKYMINPNHFIRQSALIDATKLDKKIVIIGAGGIGSWTALALTKMGCSDVTVLDFDTIEEHNLGSQIYNESDIGLKKVDALKEKVEHISASKIHILKKKYTKNTSFRQFLQKFDIIISAVDSIVVRTDMFHELLEDEFSGWYIDGRMAANEINLYCIKMDNKKHTDLYEETLFKPSEAVAIPCSARAVIYNCFVISGLIADLVAQITNETVTKQEIIVDLINLMMN